MVHYIAFFFFNINYNDPFYYSFKNYKNKHKNIMDHDPLHSTKYSVRGRGNLHSTNELYQEDNQSRQHLQFQVLLQRCW